MALGKAVDVLVSRGSEEMTRPSRLLRTLLAGAQGAEARWAGVLRESLTQATDLVSGPGGGGCDLEMADSF